MFIIRISWQIFLPNHCIPQFEFLLDKMSMIDIQSPWGSISELCRLELWNMLVSFGNSLPWHVKNKEAMTSFALVNVAVFKIQFSSLFCISRLSLFSWFFCFAILSFIEPYKSIYG